MKWLKCSQTNENSFDKPSTPSSTKYSRKNRFLTSPSKSWTAYLRICMSQNQFFSKKQSRYQANLNSPNSKSMKLTNKKLFSPISIRLLMSMFRNIMHCVRIKRMGTICLISMSLLPNAMSIFHLLLFKFVCYPKSTSLSEQKLPILNIV